MNRIITIMVSLLLLGGCTGTPRNLDASFGNSVRSTIEMQTLNPYAAAGGPKPVMSMDGEKAAGNLEAYRQDVQKKLQVRDVVNVGVSR